MHRHFLARARGRAGMPVFVAAALALAAAPNIAHAQWAPNGVPLTLAALAQTAPLACSDGAGGAYVVWIDARSGNPDLYAQHVTSVGARAPGWPADGLPVCTDAATQKDVALESDGNGGAYLAWSDDRGGVPDIYCHRLVTGGLAPGWPANGRVVCGATNIQANPAVTSDGGTGAFVAWSDIRGSSEDIYVQHVLVGGTVDPAWTVDGNLVVNALQQQAFPTIVRDGVGGALLAWVDGRNGGALTSQKDIFALRITGAGALSVGWPANGVALAIVPGKDQDLPVAIADGAGGEIVAWEDGRNGTAQTPDTDIYAMRILGDATLAAGWTADGVEVVHSVGEQTSPVLVSDGAAGAILAWRDARDTSTFPTNDDVYGLRLLANGTRAPGWPANGMNLSVESSKQTEPSICTDGAGGALLAWRDGRTGAELYAQHVKGDGTRADGWPADGLPVCTALNTQQAPTLVSDGVGGGVCAWEDERNGFSNHDIYAQRFLGSGQMGPVTGIPPAGGLRRIGLGFAGAHPSRGSARFAVDLPVAGQVDAAVYNTAGRPVARLWTASDRPAGPQVLTWDGEDGAGHVAPPGMYYLRVLAGPDGAALRFVHLP